MKIGKNTVVSSAICESDEHTITVRGIDLCRDAIGKLSFADYFFLLLTGNMPTPAASAVLNATLVAIAEHGLVPSVQASRMTFAAAPDSMQGAVAAGLLGCGSVILGAAQTAGQLFDEIDRRSSEGGSLQESADSIVQEYVKAKRSIPGYGHPLHKGRDPRVDALFDVARNAGANLRYIEIATAVEAALPKVTGRTLKLNVSAAIPAVLLGVGFPIAAMKGVPLLARTAGLVAHLLEEQEHPIGFALSYQATKEYNETTAATASARQAGAAA